MVKCDGLNMVECGGLNSAEYKRYVAIFVEISEYARARIKVHGEGLNNDPEIVRGVMLLAIDDIARYCAKQLAIANYGLS